MAADSGTTHFTGSIGANTCVVALGTASGALNQSVNLGTFGANDVTGQPAWTPLNTVPFNYAITGCPATYHQVVATFTYAPDTSGGSANDVILNTGAGKGVGVIITPAEVFNANTIPTGGNITANITNGSATIQGYAHAIRDKVTPVVDGPITTQADVTITYK